jgi:biotin carboxylase
MENVTATPNVLFVGGGGANSLSVDVALTAIAAAKALGARVHVTNQADTLAATPMVAAAADAASAVDFTDPSETVDWALSRVRAGERFDAVFGVRELAAVAVADVAAALGLPGNPPDAVRRVRGKDTCRAALAAAGFAQPSFEICDGPGAALGFMARTDGPWVVKPRDAMGSEGVSKVCGPDDLPGAVAALPARDPFLIERFVPGPEYSVEGVFLGGRPSVLAITAKDKLPPPRFVEIGHTLPAALPPDTQRRIDATVTAAVAALGLRFGLFHVELWLSPDGIVLGEVHARNGGGWIHTALAHAIPGLDMFGTVLADAIGLPVSVRSDHTRAAAVRFFQPPAGRLVEVEGWDALLAHPAVLHADLTARPGDVLRPPRDGEDRVGCVVVGASTARRAAALAAELAGSVRFAVAGPVLPNSIGARA